MIQKILPEISDIAKNSVFGMACSEIFAKEPESSENMESMSAELTALELPLDFFKFHRNTKKVSELKKSFPVLFTGSFLDESVARNLPYASESIFKEFRDYARKVLSAAKDAGVNTLTFDPGMNRILENANARNTLTRLLKEIFPTLEKLNSTLLIPFDLPAKEEQIVTMLAFLRNSMIPNLKVRLNVHPHEIPRGMMPEKLAGGLRLEVGAIHFLYNADAGNFLVPEHLSPWLESLSKLGFHGPYFAAPQTADHGEFFFHEAEKFAKTAEILRKKKENAATANFISGKSGEKRS